MLRMTWPIYSMSTLAVMSFYKRNYPNEYLIKDWISSYLAEFNGQEPTKVGFEKISSNYIDSILFDYCTRTVFLNSTRKL